MELEISARQSTKVIRNGENHNRRTALNCIILLKSHEHMVVHAFAHETYSSVNFHPAHYFGAKNEITRCILENRISENHYLHFDIGLVFIVIIDNARSIMGIISRARAHPTDKVQVKQNSSSSRRGAGCK
jgi:DNA gyrase/topoisomerase IV subunit B